MNRKTMCLILAASCLTFAGTATAECGSSKAARQGFLLSLPGLREDRALHATADSAQAAKDDSDPIVGLWDVKFISGGQLFDEGFDQYHSDGTEILNDLPPFPNVCLGVWVKSGPRSYKLKHPFWISDSNQNLIGRGLVTEHFTMDPGNNSYSGSFTFEYRDLAGKTMPSLPDVSGQLTAKRITAD